MESTNLCTAATGAKVFGQYGLICPLLSSLVFKSHDFRLCRALAVSSSGAGFEKIQVSQIFSLSPGAKLQHYLLEASRSRKSFEVLHGLSESLKERSTSCTRSKQTGPETRGPRQGGPIIREFPLTCLE